MNVRLYVWQRITASLMVPLIVIHLGVMIYAIRGGLSAGEILGRTRGSVAWGLFYGIFVLLAAVHGAIGIRSVTSEWTRLRGRSLDLIMWGVGLSLALLGLRAVFAVIVP
jgi:fumarate reductase subunit C